MSVPALLDTGASATVVRASVLAGMGFQPAKYGLLKTPSTTKPVLCPLYRIRIVLTKALGFDVQVVGGALGGQDIDCLIGRDILQHMVFTYNGPKQQFTLSFIEEVL